MIFDNIIALIFRSAFLFFCFWLRQEFWLIGIYLNIIFLRKLCLCDIFLNILFFISGYHHFLISLIIFVGIYKWSFLNFFVFCLLPELIHIYRTEFTKTLIIYYWNRNIGVVALITMKSFSSIFLLLLKSHFFHFFDLFLF